MLVCWARRSCGKASRGGTESRRRWISSPARTTHLEEPNPTEEQEPSHGSLNVSHPSYMIWGCNTGVGKTLVSTGIAAAALNPPNNSSEQQEAGNVLYLKPLQTGFPNDSDARFVSRKVDTILGRGTTTARLLVSNRTMRVSDVVNQSYKSRDPNTIPDHVFPVEQHAHPKLWSSCVADEGDFRATPSTLTCKTLWSWYAAVSPHLAASKEGGCVGDSELLDSVRSSLWGFNKQGVVGRSWAFVETAGGVASPGPSGTLQCDLYRPLRLPGILVGDGRLGGISTTLSAYESLLLRGYETTCILLQDFGLGNHEQLSKCLHHQVPVLALPPVPEDESDDLVNWFHDSSETFLKALTFIEDAHVKRLKRLNEMPRKASELLWWPFTQHSLVPEDKVTVIDSRSGELFSVYEKAQSSISQSFDACASWWTQGPDAAMQHELSKSIAYAAGRYGHVMFPENVHEPGLQCAELLLQGVGQGWAHRVYFSDNGSTAIEIALKMAFRKFAADHDLLQNSGDKNPQFKVIALRGSYHGDTLGAMEAQASSPYTGFRQQPWYSGRGLFLEPPTVFCREAKWHLQLPNEYAPASPWSTRDDVFAFDRDHSELAQKYASVIDDKISNFGDKMTKAAALIIEPIIHAAGGMEMVDPLFQRILVQQCKRHRIPVIFDEVFTGCWRLGAESASQLLGCKPDIACYAKLLTGGTVPLAATLASQDIFQAFEGPSKLDALLHGHSYTAHPIGCSAAVCALQWFKDPVKNPNILPGTGRLLEQWDEKLVREISSLRSVERVVSLGNVFAFELRAADKGYSSLQSKNLVAQLRETEKIYVRPLGNTVYFMCGPITKSSTCSTLLTKLLSALRNMD